MIAEKVMLYRCQIRKRNVSRKMEKIRFFNWLQSYPGYDELLDNFLFLVAKCKLSEQKPQLQPLEQLIDLINSYSKDWNAFILICQQIAQMNLISLICQKVGDIKIICNLIQAIVTNTQYEQLNNQQWKIAIKETHQVIHKCSYQQILRRMLRQVNQLLKITINNELINRMLKIICFLVNLDCIQQQIINSIVFQFISGQQNASDLTILLSNYVQNNWSSLKISSIQYCIRTISFMEQKISNFSQQTNNSYQKTIRQTKLLSTILTLLHNIPQLIHFNRLWQVIIKLLTNLNINKSQHQKIVSILLHNHKQRQKNSSKQQQIGMDIQILGLLCKISYRQEWMCYAHIQHFILYMLNKIQQEQNNKSLQVKQNIFTKAQIQFFNRHEVDYLRNRQNYIINLLINTIINEYSHYCSYDYYEIMEQIAQDLLQAGVLKKWCSHWKIVQNMQHLMVRLLSVKKDKIRVAIIQISVNLFKYKNLSKDVKKKINLSIRLNGLHKLLSNISDVQYDMGYGSNQSNYSDEDDANQQTFP